MRLEGSLSVYLHRLSCLEFSLEDEETWLEFPVNFAWLSWQSREGRQTSRNDDEDKNSHFRNTRWSSSHKKYSRWKKISRVICHSLFERHYTVFFVWYRRTSVRKFCQSELSSRKEEEKTVKRKKCHVCHEGCLVGGSLPQKTWFNDTDQWECDFEYSIICDVEFIIQKVPAKVTKNSLLFRNHRKKLVIIVTEMFLFERFQLLVSRDKFQERKTLFHSMSLTCSDSWAEEENKIDSCSCESSTAFRTRLSTFKIVCETWLLCTLSRTLHLLWETFTKSWQERANSEMKMSR
jgi:hypothetical protein